MIAVVSEAYNHRQPVLTKSRAGTVFRLEHWTNIIKHLLVKASSHVPTLHSLLFTVYTCRSPFRLLINGYKFKLCKGKLNNGWLCYVSGFKEYLTELTMIHLIIALKFNALLPSLVRLCMNYEVLYLWY